MSDTADGEQDDEVRQSRDTGGDAEAAASVADREAVARGDDDLFGGEDEEGDRDGED